MQKLPTLKRHKTGTAYCRWQGKCVYFGKFDLPESQERFVAWLATINRTQTTASEPVQPGRITIAKLCGAFLRHADVYYRRADGTPTGEANNFRFAVRELCEQHGHIKADELSRKILKDLQSKFVTNGLARSSVNTKLRKMRHVFKWGFQEELVAHRVLEQFDAVQALAAGRTAAKETEPVGPVEESRILAVKPFVTRPVWGIILFCWKTGARPGEAMALRWADLNQSQDVWLYQPKHHKTAHKGIERTILIGPEVQSVLTDLRHDGEYVFSPLVGLRESETYSVLRKIGQRYTNASLISAVRKACERAFDCPKELKITALKPKHGESAKAFSERKKRAAKWRDENVWSPNQLRHTFATTSRSAGNLDVVQMALGHTTRTMTEHYAKPDLTALADFLRQNG